MQFKVLLSAISLAFVLGFTSNSLANRLSPPKKCPSASAIIQVGLDRADDLDLIHWWGMTDQTHMYDTEKMWEFKIGKFTTSDRSDAIAQARKSLLTLVYKDGPNDDGGTPDGEFWTCNYVTADGYQGTAMTVVQ